MIYIQIELVMFAQGVNDDEALAFVNPLAPCVRISNAHVDLILRRRTNKSQRS